MKNNARLYDPTLLIQAGIDPKTGLPYKLGNVADNNNLKEAYLKCFRIKDEQDAINRYVWKNLPNGLDGRLLERVLYYRGQGMFFYMKSIDKFYFLPYALQSPDDGAGIDVYGRYRGVTPLPFNGSTSQGKDGKKGEKPWIVGLVKKPIYDIPLEEVTPEDMESFCVLIKDYSEQLPQKNIERQLLQEPILQHMADIPCFARTALLSNTGISGMRVGNENEASQVYDCSSGINSAALTGRKFVPVIGTIEFQELTGGNAARSEEFSLALETLDNIRLSFYGIPNGGIFQKKAHMLESEAQLNAGASDLALEDGLRYRIDACNLINSIWGLGVDCEINPSLLGAGLVVDEDFAPDNQTENDDTEKAKEGGDNE